MSNNINKEILKTEKKEKFLSKKLSYDLEWLSLILVFSMMAYFNWFNDWLPDAFYHITKSWLFNGMFFIFVNFIILAVFMFHHMYVYASATPRAILIFLVFHLSPLIYYLYIWTI